MSDDEWTRLTDDEVWGLHEALAGLIGDALRRLADDPRSLSYPMDTTWEQWHEDLRRAADDFEHEDLDHIPSDGLKFITERWGDLWD